jgi:hypothetical protein
MQLHLHHYVAAWAHNNMRTFSRFASHYIVVSQHWQRRVIVIVHVVAAGIRDAKRNDNPDNSYAKEQRTHGRRWRL